MAIRVGLARWEGGAMHLASLTAVGLPWTRRLRIFRR
jgi:hypothetical protein